jgi:predicted aspartyl protease
MGTFSKKVKVSNVADRARSVEVEALVDTGATYSLISGEKLDDVGARPIKTIRLRTIEGELIERQMATVVITLDGLITSDDVVIGQAGDLEVIGARTLEGLGVAADPVGKKLVPVIPLAL